MCDPQRQEDKSLVQGDFILNLCLGAERASKKKKQMNSNRETNPFSFFFFFFWIGEREGKGDFVQGGCEKNEQKKKDYLYCPFGTCFKRTQPK